MCNMALACVVYLDASKAFDRANHSKPVTKLMNGGSPKLIVSPFSVNGIVTNLFVSDWNHYYPSSSLLIMGLDKGGLCRHCYLIRI